MARLAQDAHAAALIVVNTDDVSFGMIGTSGDPGKGIDIPVLLVGNTDGSRCLESGEAKPRGTQRPRADAVAICFVPSAPGGRWALTGVCGAAGVLLSISLNTWTQEHTRHFAS